jgi:glycine/D-amino acid oxidase-like deaminating enzyme
MPDFVQARAHRMVSTFVAVTPPLPRARLWPSRALVWEASRPYLYLRTTADDRIIVGGEDEPITDATRRDVLVPKKAATLVAKLNAIMPRARIDAADFAWAGFFGETTDGLPLIGPVPGRAHMYAAYGYGGNGITFSRLAADMIAGLIAGNRDPDEELFAIDRD